jgi:hypothetical protein
VARHARRSLTLRAWPQIEESVVLSDISSDILYEKPTA